MTIKKKLYFNEYTRQHLEDLKTNKMESLFTPIVIQEDKTNGAVKSEKEQVGPSN